MVGCWVRVYVNVAVRVKCAYCEKVTTLPWTVTEWANSNGVIPLRYPFQKLGLAFCYPFSAHEASLIIIFTYTHRISQHDKAHRPAPTEVNQQTPVSDSIGFTTRNGPPVRIALTLEEFDWVVEKMVAMLCRRALLSTSLCVYLA